MKYETEKQENYLQKKKNLTFSKTKKMNLFEIDRKCVVRRIMQIPKEDKNTKSVLLLLFTVTNTIHFPTTNVNILHFITNVK